MVRVFSLASGRVWCGIQRVENCSADLTAAERNCILGEPLKRVNEFSTGRVLIRTLLAKFGVMGLSVLPGRNGAPMWPEGFTGSVSHSDEYCFVTVTNCAAVSLGVDVQKVVPVTVDFTDMILTDRERKAVAEEQYMERNVWTNMLFSAKESVFKSLSPKMQAITDFRDVEISFRERQFVSRIPRYGLSLNGVSILRDGYVFSGISRRVNTHFSV
ncbi:MAG: 4'-phosphopantetheinyl transferase superfamily protein [Flavipsychrobacter sp.]|nr:4'-phosphopantetheinyl transferase superfamily protein [Flavipsychrobacter sp.]